MNEDPTDRAFERCSRQMSPVRTSIQLSKLDELQTVLKTRESTTYSNEYKYSKEYVHMTTCVMTRIARIRFRAL